MTCIMAWAGLFHDMGRDRRAGKIFLQAGNGIPICGKLMIAVGAKWNKIRGVAKVRFRQIPV